MVEKIQEKNERSFPQKTESDQLYTKIIPNYLKLLITNHNPVEL